MCEGKKWEGGRESGEGKVRERKIERRGEGESEQESVRIEYERGRTSKDGRTTLEFQVKAEVIALT